MKTVKKVSALLLAVLMAGSVLMGCQKKEAGNPEDAPKAALTEIVNVFKSGDMDKMKEISGEGDSIEESMSDMLESFGMDSSDEEGKKMVSEVFVSMFGKVEPSVEKVEFTNDDKSAATLTVKGKTGDLASSFGDWYSALITEAQKLDPDEMKGLSEEEQQKKVMDIAMSTLKDSMAGMKTVDVDTQIKMVKSADKWTVDNSDTGIFELMFGCSADDFQTKLQEALAGAISGAA